MLNRNAKTLKVYSARITNSKHLYFVNLLRISINEIYANPDHTHVLGFFVKSSFIHYLNK